MVTPVDHGLSALQVGWRPEYHDCDMDLGAVGSGADTVTTGIPDSLSSLLGWIVMV